MQGHGELAVHAELELVGGAVADPDGGGVLIAGQPVQFGLSEPGGCYDRTVATAQGTVTVDRRRC
ncbi:hypothetical protein OHA91_03315 [Streptomyces erythrochromogenes]|uniref:Uncharacterized protein n=1 Tax=Streptomyces erythrochromogenes TaxID=285574 RepID=A0ABZ1Q5D4_9ACTN|nr:hypothetical protein [Streptomyces erythrochromogenes]MCX5583553.1 hypothetical protein [Streptomyces erythrochromogenes]